MKRTLTCRFLAFAVIVGVTVTASAEKMLDFRGKAAQIVVDPGGFAAMSEIRQVEDVPDGVLVRVDVDKECAFSKWATLTTESFGGGEWIGREFVLYCKGNPKGRVAKGFSINFTDRDGETLQVRPRQSGLDDSGRYFQRFLVPESGSTWGGGAKGNGRLDRPVKLSGINLYYDKVFGSGEVVLQTIENIEDGTVRETISHEVISTDVTYPGAEPFHGTERIVALVEPPYDGSASMELVTDPRGSAWEGGTRIRLDGTARNGKIIFESKLPYAKQYEFLSLSCPTGVHLVKMVGEFRQSAAEAMRLDVETGNPLHIVRDESERPSLVIKNPSASAVRWKTSFVFTDVFSRKFEIPFERTMSPHETVEVPIPWPLPAKGLWRVKSKVLADDGSIAERQTRFAYIDRHERTPLLEKPKFRIGVHYHGTYYLPGLVDKTIDALVACGAKISRTDYSFRFADIARPDGTYFWGKSDLMLKKLRDANLALDLIIASGRAPEWAVDPDALAARTEKRARETVLLTKPGVFRDFCTAFARRYNRNVDYYEIGNEWDMHYTKSLTNAEALRMQAEAYEGVHRGYPDGCVTPNGWSSVTSAANLWGRATENMGIIEEFASHPELYDAWALHAHCAPSMFYQQIRRCFLTLREATGMKTRPWICNETALTCGFGGEDAVGRAIWEKVLYAWGWGASDYIWYNLRATGWFAGHESGYGLITADFYPRAGYAAMAALTTIFHGLDSDGRIYSEGERHLMRFKGRSFSGQFDGVVLAAWDSATDARRRKIRIRTDAQSAEKSDYMGNRFPMRVEDGLLTIEMGEDPSAYLLRGATLAEAVDIGEISDPKTVAIRIDSSRHNRPADFVLDSMDQVRDYYQALPQYVRRTWGGQEDHSVRLWLDRASNGCLRVRARVQDDIRGPEDGLEIFVAPVGGELQKHLVRPTERIGTVDHYDAVLPFDEEMFDFTVHALEDDGDGGLDGYLQLTGDSEPPKRIELR